MHIIVTDSAHAEEGDGSVLNVDMVLDKRNDVDKPVRIADHNGIFLFVAPSPVKLVENLLNILTFRSCGHCPSERRDCQGTEPQSSDCAVSHYSGATNGAQEPGTERYSAQSPDESVKRFHSIACVLTAKREQKKRGGLHSTKKCGILRTQFKIPSGCNRSD